MTRYSIQPRDRIFVKSYGFLSFSKNIGENIGRNISKSLNSKCSRKLDLAKQSATDGFKTSSKKVIKKTVEATSDLTGNKIADKITRVSKIYLRNNQKRMKKKYFERYISSTLRQKNIDDLRLRKKIFNNLIIKYNGISINNKFVRKYTKSTNEI